MFPPLLPFIIIICTRIERSGILWGKAAEYEAGGCVGDIKEDTIMHLTLTTFSHIIAGTRKCKFIYTKQG